MSSGRKARGKVAKAASDGDVSRSRRRGAPEGDGNAAGPSLSKADLQVVLEVFYPLAAVGSGSAKGTPKGKRKKRDEDDVPASEAAAAAIAAEEAAGSDDGDDEMGDADGDREQQSSAEALRLKQLLEYDVLDSPAEDSYDRFASLAGRIFQAPIVLICFLGSDRLWIKSAVGYDQDRNFPCALHPLAVTSTPKIVQDLHTVDEFVQHPGFRPENPLKFFASFPLISGQSNHLGCLVVLDVQSKPAFTLESEGDNLCFLGQTIVRQLDMRLLTKHNEMLTAERRELLQELTQLRSNIHKLDLSSPLENVLNILGRLKRTNALPTPDLQEFDEAVRQLVTSANVYIPDIRRQLASGPESMDQDTQHWLMKELAPPSFSAAAPLATDIPNHFNGPVSMAEDFDAFVRTTLPNCEDPAALKRLLEEELDCWEFDSFRAAQVCGHQPLIFVGYSVFEKWDLLNKFHIPSKVLLTFLKTIQSGYKASSSMFYHTSAHAVDVLISVHYMLRKVAAHVTDLEVFATLFAAIIHDVKHPGTNNEFMIVTESETALVYNERSVLESMHCSEGFRVMRNAGANLLSNVDKAQRKQFRGIATELVLATDLARHFEAVGQFKSQTRMYAKAEGASADSPAVLEPDTKVRLLQMILKCADVGHISKPRAIHLEWTFRLMAEFFAQGDRERELGLQISPFMDRENMRVPKTQVNFISYLVAPMYEALGSFLEALGSSIAECTEHLEQNLQYWSSLSNGGTEDGGWIEWQAQQQQQQQSQQSQPK